MNTAAAIDLTPGRTSFESADEYAEYMRHQIIDHSKPPVPYAPVDSGLLDRMVAGLQSPAPVATQPAAVVQPPEPAVPARLRHPAWEEANVAEKELGLSYAACVALGIDEHCRPEMQFRAYKAQCAQKWAAPSEYPEEVARQMNVLCTAASRRKKSHSQPRWVHYYAQRQMLRNIGGNPNDVPVPERRVLEKRLTAAELRAEREELLTMKRPARTAPTGTDDRLAQEAEWRKWKRAEPLQREAARKKRQEAAEGRDVYAIGEQRLFGIDEAEAAKVRRRAARIARRNMTWAMRVLDDMRTCVRLERPIPRAKRHRWADVPLHERRHWAHHDDVLPPLGEGG